MSLSLLFFWFGVSEICSYSSDQMSYMCRIKMKDQRSDLESFQVSLCLPEREKTSSCLILEGRQANDKPIS